MITDDRRSVSLCGARLLSDLPSSASGPSARSGDWMPLRQPKDALLLIDPRQIIIPPLHTIQGCTNRLLTALSDKKALYDIFAAAKVTPSHQTTSVLNGRDGRRFLDFVLRTIDVNLEYVDSKSKQKFDLRPVFHAISDLQRWAVASKFNTNIDELRQDATQLSESWRAAGLPAINKLHLLEAHLVDFVDVNKSWGVFGEQGLEALHYIGNVAAGRCFGANDDHRLPFFLRRQLMVSLANEPEFSRKERQRSGSSVAEEETLIFEVEVPVEHEEILNGFDEDEEEYEL